MEMPSMALPLLKSDVCPLFLTPQGFFCRTEDDFDDWCMRFRKLSHTRAGLPMFELIDCQPSHFACSVDVLNLNPDFSDSDRLERFFDSEDEEFEILSL
ncbi:unnamed protein product [Oncorhynchus mykiss]|uniref:Cysteine protease n=1 Tax=Oncorhynchus mykiss TaxID=8022 RepID=A0A060Y4G8_ONCMY|nr:unnamed protein product [Oncorhynchus mykiss]